jgi:hypothetical protein
LPQLFFLDEREAVWLIQERACQRGAMMTAAAFPNVATASRLSFLPLHFDGRGVNLAAMKVLLEEDEEFAEATEFGALQPVLQPYFPEWRNNLSWPAAVLANGLYIFKVSLDAKTWRRIVIPATLTLDDLSDTILRAFNFDNDHLYEFSYRSRFGTFVRVLHPYMEESPATDEVAIGEIPLRPGVSMEYLFDFGDQWRFNVKLERIDPADARVKKPKLLEKHGPAPPQYPNLDEAE